MGDQGNATMYIFGTFATKHCHSGACTYTPIEQAIVHWTRKHSQFSREGTKTPQIGHHTHTSSAVYQREYMHTHMADPQRNVSVQTDV